MRLRVEAVADDFATVKVQLLSWLQPTLVKGHAESKDASRWASYSEFLVSVGVDKTSAYVVLADSLLEAAVITPAAARRYAISCLESGALTIRRKWTIYAEHAEARTRSSVE